MTVIYYLVSFMVESDYKGGDFYEANSTKF